jgi:hypothetical protein
MNNFFFARNAEKEQEKEKFNNCLKELQGKQIWKMVITKYNKEQVLKELVDKIYEIDKYKEQNEEFEESEESKMCYFNCYMSKIVLQTVICLLLYMYFMLVYYNWLKVKVGKSE